MAKDNKEPTTVERKVDGKVVNARQIEWPFDPYGITSMLKKEGVRAVGRIKGDKEKLAVFNGVLKCLAEHASTKIADQNKEKAQTLAAVKNREAAEEALSVANQKREIERLEKLLASAKDTLAAKVAAAK